MTWHGSRLQNVIDRAPERSIPMRLHFGGDDSHVPMEVVEAVRAAFAQHDDVEIAVHPGADHGFSHAGQAHDPDAERAAMRGVLELIGALTSV